MRRFRQIGKWASNRACKEDSRQGCQHGHDSGGKQNDFTYRRDKWGNGIFCRRTRDDDHDTNNGRIALASQINWLHNKWPGN